MVAQEKWGCLYLEEACWCEEVKDEEEEAQCCVCRDDGLYGIGKCH